MGSSYVVDTRPCWSYFFCKYITVLRTLRFGQQETLFYDLFTWKTSLITPKYFIYPGKSFRFFVGLDISVVMIRKTIKENIVKQRFQKKWLHIEPERKIHTFSDWKLSKLSWSASSRQHWSKHSTATNFRVKRFFRLRYTQ